jgi:aromatic-L-amino-acid decarboxylase
MTAEAFRQSAHAAVEWVAQYLEQLEAYPVQAPSAPGQILAALPESPPASGEPFEEVLRDLEHIILPGITHWQSPHFFGYFPSNSSGPAIIAELISAGLGVQGMLWSTSPSCTELEMRMLDWLAQMLDLPKKFRSTAQGGGVIQDSASSAVLCALLAARERATQGTGNRAGLRHLPLVALRLKPSPFLH